MSAGRLFGTDGIRGRANTEPMTPETALRVGRAVAAGCVRQGKPVAVIGRDTRRSGPMLESALTAGLCSAGIEVREAGELPTPAVALLTRSVGAGAGIVVSASHNPFEDNGIKVFAGDGFKLADSDERDIEARVRQAEQGPLPTGAAVGQRLPLADAEDRYVDFLKRQLPSEGALQGLRLVIDCAHGAAYRVGPRVLRELGADVVAIGVQPDGLNINDGVGALHPERLRTAVLSERAELGIALDGDADRVVLVDERGDVVDGDEILAVAAKAMHDQGRAPSAVVGTIMSNMGLEVALRRLGIPLLRAGVGDRLVVERMLIEGSPLGGEPSGHVVFIETATTGDGLLAALRTLGVMRERKEPLSALRAVMHRFPQTLRNVRVTRKSDLDSLPAVRAATQRVQAALEDRGRLLVRFSGTEPVVRVMVEGESADEVEAFADEVAGAVRDSIGT